MWNKSVFAKNVLVVSINEQNYVSKNCIAHIDFELFVFKLREAIIWEKR